MTKLSGFDLLQSVFPPSVFPSTLGHWSVISTGGGCLAFSHPAADGGYILVTDENLTLDADADAIEWTVGRYNPEGDWIDDANDAAYTLRDAILRGEQIAAT